MSSAPPQETKLPIEQLKNSLASVYKFCEQSADPVVSSLAAKGIDGDRESGLISLSADLAHWLSSHPHLVVKASLQIVCPVTDGFGIDGFDEAGQAHTVGHAVGMLLGRGAGSVSIQIVQMQQNMIHGVADCFNCLWRKAPGTEGFGDAVWLGSMDAEEMLQFFCFSEDLAGAVYAKVPVGLSAKCESHLSKKLEVLRICGFYTDPGFMENQLGDMGPEWEAYRHDKTCAFDTTSSYLVSISGQNEKEVDSSAIRAKVKECQEMFGFIKAGREMAVEVIRDNTFEWCYALPGTLLKCRFDSNAGERYQVLDSTWMTRMSDGAIICMVPGQDFRGCGVATLEQGMMAQHPGLKSGWLARSMWGEFAFHSKESELKGREPLINRNSGHDSGRKLSLTLSEMPAEEAQALMPIYGGYISDGTQVSDEALVFFRLMQDARYDLALEYLKGRPELINCKDADGDTPLMLAVNVGNLDLVKKLLALGADVNVPAVDGFCAIHLAARNGFTTIAAKLLEAGANVESITPHGWTPLMCAIQIRSEGCAKLLVRHGAQTKTCVHGSIAAMAKSAGIKLR